MNEIAHIEEARATNALHDCNKQRYYRGGGGSGKISAKRMLNLDAVAVRLMQFLFVHSNVFFFFVLFILPPLPFHFIL